MGRDRHPSGVYVLELGGQDDAFAAREAASAASDVTLLAPGMAAARGVTDRVARLAFTRRASDLVGTCDPDPESAVALLAAAGLERTGSVAVRAVDVRGSTGVDTRRVERDLGAVLVERGFTVDLEDPDHELRALFADAAGDADGDTPGRTCALGWLAAESVRDFGDRRPTDRPFFQPGSMDPLEARAVANLAGARPGRCVLDPMCGTGGVLLEAALVGADVLGGDRQVRMVAGTRENLAHGLGPARPSDERYPAPGDWGVYRGDAAHLPVRQVDAVVFDAPYGRQSKIAGDLADLVAGTLAAAREVAPRTVLVADRPWVEAARDAGWTVDARFERRVHRSLVRHVYLLE
ncbi:MAG: TIGR01177 family methyltransferase [Haloarculaceae archaeon]